MHMMSTLYGSNVEMAVWVTLYAIWTCAILATNGVLLAIIFRQGRPFLDYDTNVLVLSLIAARTLVGVTVLPVSTAGLFYADHVGSLLCKLSGYATLVSSVASAASIVGLAVATRREALCRGHRTRSGFMVGAAWLLALSYATRVGVFNDLVAVDGISNGVFSCTIQFRYESIDNWFATIDAAFVLLSLSVVLLWVYVSVADHIGARNRQADATRKVIGTHYTGPTEHPAAAGDTGQTTNRGGSSAFVANMGENTNNPSEADAGETDHAIHANERSETGRRDTGTDETHTMNVKLCMLAAVVTCFVLTTIVPYAWQVVRFLCDSDGIRDNYRHIDRAVFLFSHTNPWLNALILLYYRPVLRVNPAPARP